MTVGVAAGELCARAMDGEVEDRAELVRVTRPDRDQPAALDGS
jgi:hypothetical protein